MKDLILKAYHGGLGDNLQFSTLPELYSKQGYNVYISANAPFRNEEILPFVWLTNPYIKGIKNSSNWDIGDTPAIKLLNKTNNGISNWEVAHGFLATNKYPKIYQSPYKINHISKYDNDKRKEDLTYSAEIAHHEYGIIDASNISIPYNPAELISRVENLVNDIKIPFYTVDLYRAVIPNNSRARNTTLFQNPKIGKMPIYSLMHYWDILGNASYFISCLSGSSHLSSAVKEYNPELKSFCIVPKKAYDVEKTRGTFLFDNIEHILID